MLNSSSLNSATFNGPSNAVSSLEGTVSFTSHSLFEATGERDRQSIVAFVGSSSANVVAHVTDFAAVAFTGNGVFQAIPDIVEDLESIVAFTGSGVLVANAEKVQQQDGIVNFTMTSSFTNEFSPLIKEATVSFEWYPTFRADDASAAYADFTGSGVFIVSGYKYVDAPPNRQFKMSNKKRKLRLSK